LNSEDEEANIMYTSQDYYEGVSHAISPYMHRLLM